MAALLVPSSQAQAADGNPDLGAVDFVVGGATVPAGEHGYVVSIQQRTGPVTWTHFCTGTLIQPSWVLTAAHCLSDTAPPLQHVRVVSGTQDLGATGQTSTIASAFVFPWFLREPTLPYSGDLALLQLSSASASPTLGLADAATEPFWDGTSGATVVGWGDSESGPGQTFPTHLQHGQVTIGSDSACAAALGAIYDVGGDICTSVEGVSACNGDSGGPVIATSRTGDDVLVGIISSGAAGCNGPGDYTRVSAFRGWIDATTGEGEFEDGNGYWLANTAGHTRSFGGAVHWGNGPADSAESGFVDFAAAPDGRSYWYLTAIGRLDGLGLTGWADQSSAPRPLEPGEVFTSLAMTPTGDGLWLFTSAGRLVTLGDAGRFPANGQLGQPDDLAALILNGPIIDARPTPTGNGYYMVGSDGGVFTFGDARFAGSTGSTPSPHPVFAIASTSNP
ncbi:MAG: serine protease [Actinomycetia bacterium]|nr:serine protease [Actinomycetes bacterium]